VDEQCWKLTQPRYPLSGTLDEKMFSQLRVHVQDNPKNEVPNACNFKTINPTSKFGLGQHRSGL